MKFSSQIVTAASGSVGGCTYSRNRSGMYIRGRSMPVNPNSTQQNVVRTALATLVAQWTATLTQAARDTWSTWAANTPQLDALGNPINITGQNAFIKMNVQRIQVGLNIVQQAPAVFAGAALTPPNLVSATFATQLLSVTFSNTDAWATAVGGALLVYQGRPQNPSKLFFAGPYRFAAMVLGAVVPPVSPAAIAAVFPFLVGQRIHVRFVAVQTDARISTRQLDSVISI